tara:strand:+ start:115 stop:909 length:795 start_codon:yes stop_codon:yes gene_type:complete
MVKKRVIFKLIFKDEAFYLSRNFSLQKAGDTSWLYEKMKFQKISNFIDELIILNASDNNKDNPLSPNFKKSINLLMRKTFIPLTIGGGLTNLDQVDECFKLGADKVVLNTSIKSNPNLIYECSKKYGAQAISIGIDFRKLNNSKNNNKFNYFSFINNGNDKFMSLNEHIKLIKKFNFGELMLTSIDMDGTGFGFDYKVLELLDKSIKFPILLSGGAGKPEHFEELIKNKKISALVTGNLYNFLGNGLEVLRKKIVNKGINLRII